MWTTRLVERIAPLVGEAEPYAVIRVSEDDAVVAAYAIPNGANPEILIFADSMRDLEHLPIEKETPEEFALFSLETMAMLAKQKHPNAKVVAVLSEYNEKRFSKEKAQKLLRNIDHLLINEEIEKLSEILTHRAGGDEGKRYLEAN